MPFGKEDRFYEEDIKALVDGYREKQEKFAEMHRNRTCSDAEKAAQAEFAEYLYRPRAFYLFGNYDLAVISLIDDYTLTNRNFHPYSYFISQKNETREYSDKFNYQILTGTTPVLTHDKRQLHEDDRLFDSKLIEMAKRTFVPGPDTKLFPFIGVTRLKLNNGLLVGTGAKFVSVVEMAIKTILKQDCDTDQLNFIISESFGWHELTIVFFSNSFHRISEAIFRIRELRLHDLENFAKALFQEHIQDQSFDLYRAIVDNSLLQHFFDQDGQQESAEAAHVFVKTLTTFGFDFEFFNQIELNKTEGSLTFPAGFHEPDLTVDDLELFIKWDIKPGHLLETIAHFKALNDPFDTIEVTSGTTDFMYPGSNSGKDLASTLTIIKKLVDESFRDQDKNIRQHIRKIDTTLKFKYQEADLAAITSKSDKRQQSFFSEKLIEFSFSLKVLRTIRNDLYRCNLSKILREKVLNMFVNYNDGIQDPLLYVYFIELRPFLEEVYQMIRELASGNSTLFTNESYIHTFLDSLVDTFDLAFKNRFHQSYRMDGVTDFNMEHNGGCQQIISALDGAYKVISSVFGENNKPTSFVIVTGSSGVDSWYYSMRINYFQIFQPSIFIAPAVKESVNHFFLKLEIDEDADDPNQLLFQSLQDTERLLELIFSNLDLKQDLDLLREEYGEYLDENMLQYFRSDVMTYVYAYNLDTELFRFWYWNYFMQMSAIYNLDGKVDEGIFLQFMMRYLLIIEFFDPNFWEHRNGFLDPAVIPNTQIAGLWMLHFERLRTFVRALLADEDNQLKDWLHMTVSVTFSLTLNDVVGIHHQRIEAEEREALIANFVTRGLKKLDEDTQSKQINARRQLEIRVRDLYRRVMQAEHEYGINFSKEDQMAQDAVIQRYLSVQQDVDEIKNKFFLGEIYAYNNKFKDKMETNSPSFYLQTLFYSYLKLLMEDVMDQRKNTVLYRRKFDHPTEEEAGRGKVHTFNEYDELVTNLNDGPLVFDPMGGLFSAHMLTRRKYYQYRSTLIRSLWDMSLKIKKDMFVRLESSKTQGEI